MQCPDCGEELVRHGTTAMPRPYLKCPSCLWNVVEDEDRGADEREDYINRHCKNSNPDLPDLTDEMLEDSYTPPPQSWFDEEW